MIDGSRRRSGRWPESSDQLEPLAEDPLGAEQREDHDDGRPRVPERHRAALLQDVLKPDKNQWEESAYFWREIGRGNLAFDSREQIAEAIRAVSFEGWQAWYREHVLDNPASLLFAAPGRSGALPDVDTRIEDVEAFRESRPFFSRP